MKKENDEITDLFRSRLGNAEMTVLDGNAVQIRLSPARNWSITAGKSSSNGVTICNTEAESG